MSIKDNKLKEICEAIPEERRFSPTTLETACCPRKYYYAYLRQLRRIGERADALRLGSVFHECLEIYYAPDGADAGADSAERSG